MIAYLLAFWRGELSGPAEWLGWLGVALLGVALALAIVTALAALVRYVDRHEAPLADYTGDELAPETLTERRRRARFTSVIAVLGLLAGPVIALTR